MSELNGDRERYQRDRREQTIREICHDLRNPIATITALAAAAAHEMASPEAVVKRLAQIQEESRRMSQLVRQLLEDGTEPRLLDVSAIAGEVVASCRVTYPGTISVIAQAGAAVMVDEVGLRRSLANLIENATRAAGPEGSVQVRIRRSRGWVRCEISDSGPGFGKGPTGSQSLGLTIVDRLARDHGGRLEILDGPLGGALLRLSLPAARDMEPALGDVLP